MARWRSCAQEENVHAQSGGGALTGCGRDPPPSRLPPELTDRVQHAADKAMVYEIARGRKVTCASLGEVAYSAWTPTGLALSAACLALAAFFCIRSFRRQRHA